MTLKLISPIVVVMAIVATFYVFMPLPASMPIFSGQAIGDEKVEIVWSMHTTDDHNPYKKGSTAERLVKNAIGNWPGKPGGDWKCAAIFIGDTVLRTILWRSTGGGAGDLVWFNHQTGNWGGGFEGKPAATLQNLPYDVKENTKDFKGAKIKGGCDKSFPGGGLPPLTTR